MKTIVLIFSFLIAINVSAQFSQKDSLLLNAMNEICMHKKMRDYHFEYDSLSHQVFTKEMKKTQMFIILDSTAKDFFSLQRSLSFKQITLFIISDLWFHYITSFIYVKKIYMDQKYITIQYAFAYSNKSEHYNFRAIVKRKNGKVKKIKRIK